MPEKAQQCVICAFAISVIGCTKLMLITLLYRYGVCQDRCRVQMLLQYFGEDFHGGICNM